MDRFSYFMIRVRQPLTPDRSEAGAPLAGVVERLASGEKRSFESGVELLRLIGTWPEPPPRVSSVRSVASEPAPAQPTLSALE